MGIEQEKEKNNGKIIHFISGLPRAGTTVLANILCQNPRFHATATSGIIEILFTVRNRFCELQPFNAMDPKELERKTLNILKGIMNSWFEDLDRPVCFEKSRGWEGYLEMAEAALGRKPKVLCPVRDIREVLASFERLYRKTSSSRQLPDEKGAFWKYQTVEGRCEMLLNQEGGVVGVPIMRIKDAMARGWRKSIKFIDYDRLCDEPKTMMREIYDFLEEPHFEHNFDHIEQVTYENDLVWVYKDLHKIRPKLEPQEHTYEDTLPKELCAALEPKARFWENLTKSVKPIRRAIRGPGEQD